jgi:uncharacterized hydrophobic protein (TIGR00271 family)
MDTNPASAPAGTNAAPSRRTLAEAMQIRAKWLRRHANRGVERLGRSINHASVMDEIRDDGQLSARYVFMVVMACAIAMLGLLLSSPAVVIGAMLISPLMGPIMLLGFSLCTLDFRAMRSALKSLAAGVAGALAISILIVMISPLREATSEILARTRPNLFDLLVAVFSGLAGGYSVIHRKGATIVGVAIATALMPPLAVVGFGIATLSPAIAGGAFFLFMTNLLAIALSVTGLAWLHGFATVHSKRTARWQTLMVLIVFGALSLPLGFALRDIAYEARVSNIVRAEALKPFANAEAELASLTVNFPRNQPIAIQQTVNTHRRVANAEAELTRLYTTVLKREVKLNLYQVVVDQDTPLTENAVQRIAQSSLAPLQQRITEMDARDAAGVSVREAVSFRTLAIDIDPAARTAVIVAAPGEPITLEGYRSMEGALAARFTGWTISVVPPRIDLPVVMFGTGGAQLPDTAAPVLDTIAWSLKRWGVATCEVQGQAAVTSGGTRAANDAMALERAKAVAAALGTRGVTATAASAFGGAGQTERERELGQAAFQSATVVAKP